MNDAPINVLDVAALSTRMKYPLVDYCYSLAGLRTDASMEVWDLWVCPRGMTRANEYIGSYTTKALADEAERRVDQAIDALRILLKP